MKRESLAQYFEGVAFKRLSAVEAHPERSNQHEFDGTRPLKALLGEDRREFRARFIRLDDETVEPLTAEGALTWYDAREKHPTRSEHRLYFRDNPVSDAFSEGDLLVIARRPDETLLVVVAQAHSTAENQVILLFGLPEDPGRELEFRELRGEKARLDAARTLILELMGVEVEKADEAYLEAMLRRFPGGFPSTQEFSAYARATLPDVRSTDDPDAALLTWWDREEILFKTLERNVVAERLRNGFGEDVDGFIAYSMSIHQIRRSRAGHALENHVEQILRDHEIRYAHGKVTENRSRPDFLFPGTTEYHSATLPVARLSMLGVKSTCKDRWRQVLDEAEKIEEKHLLTLEPGITIAQTDQMRIRRLQLVLPAALHTSYRPEQREWLMNVRNFLGLVRSRQ